MWAPDISTRTIIFLIDVVLKPCNDNSVMAKGKPAFSYDDAIRFGWDSMKRNYPFFILLFVLNIGLSILRWGLSTKTSHADITASLIIFLGFFILNSLFGLGTVNTMFLIAKGKRPTFSDLFTPVNLLGNYIIASVLMMLIVLGGLLLLIVPGIILAIQFGYFSFAMIEKNLGPIEALKKSKTITKGNLWRLFFLHILLGLINLLGVLCLLVGLFATIPTTMVASAYVYRKLSAK